MLGVAESGWILGKHLSTSKRGKNETLVIDLICQTNSLPPSPFWQVFIHPLQRISYGCSKCKIIPQNQQRGWKSSTVFLPAKWIPWWRPPVSSISPHCFFPVWSDQSIHPIEVMVWSLGWWDRWGSKLSECRLSDVFCKYWLSRRRRRPRGIVKSAGTLS